MNIKSIRESTLLNDWFLLGRALYSVNLDTAKVSFVIFLTISSYGIIWNILSHTLRNQYSLCCLFKTYARQPSLSSLLPKCSDPLPIPW